MEPIDEQAKAATEPKQEASGKPEGQPAPTPEIKYDRVDLNTGNLEAGLAALYDPTIQGKGGEEKPAEPAPESGEAPKADVIEPETTAPEASETTEAPESEPQGEPEGEQEEEVALPKRQRFDNEFDQAVAALKKLNPKLSWADAEQTVRQSQGIEPEAEAPVTAEAEIAQIDEQIATLNAELDQTAEDQPLYGPEIKKKSDAIRALERKRDRLELKTEILQDQQRQVVEAQQQTTQKTFEQTRQESKAKVMKVPGMNDKNSAVYKAFKAKLDELSNPNHPDYHLIEAARAPEFVLQEAGFSLPSSPAVKAGTPVVPPVVPQTRQQVVNPPAGGTLTSQTVNPQQVVRDLVEHGSLEEAEAALYGPTDRKTDPFSLSPSR